MSPTSRKKLFLTVDLSIFYQFGVVIDALHVLRWSWKPVPRSLCGLHEPREEEKKTEAASKSDTHSLSGGLFAELKLYQQLIKSEWISMRLRKHLRHRIPFFLCARFHLFLLDLKHDDEKWTFTFYMHTRILWQIVAGFVWLKVQAMLLLALTRFDTLFIESRSINSFLTTSFWQT